MITWFLILYFSAITIQICDILNIIYQEFFNPRIAKEAKTPASMLQRKQIAKEAEDTIKHGTKKKLLKENLSVLIMTHQRKWQRPTLASLISFIFWKFGCSIPHWALEFEQTAHNIMELKELKAKAYNSNQWYLSPLNYFVSLLTNICLVNDNKVSSPPIYISA